MIGHTQSLLAAHRPRRSQKDACRKHAHTSRAGAFINIGHGSCAPDIRSEDTASQRNESAVNFAVDPD